MAELDEALNSILSNPEAMGQIARLAQSWNLPGPWDSTPQGNGRNLTGPDTPGAVPVGPNPMGPNSPEAVPNGGTNSAPGAAAGNPGMNGFGGTLPRLLPLLQLLQSQSNSPARQLLYALRPYLRPRRRENVERALQLARLYSVGRQFLRERRGADHV